MKNIRDLVLNHLPQTVANITAPNGETYEISLTAQSAKLMRTKPASEGRGFNKHTVLTQNAGKQLALSGWLYIAEKLIRGWTEQVENGDFDNHN